MVVIKPNAGSGTPTTGWRVFDSVRNTTKKGISWAKGFFGGEDNED